MIKNGILGLILGTILTNNTPLSSMKSISNEDKLRLEVQRLWINYGNSEFTITEKEIEKELGKWHNNINKPIEAISFEKRELGKEGSSRYNISGHRIEIDEVNLDREEIRPYLAMKLDQKELEKVIDEGNMPPLEKFEEGELITLISKLEEYANKVPESLEKIKDSIDHELSHALIDSSYGLKNSEKFDSPKIEEVKEYIAESFRGKNGDTIKKVCEDYLQRSLYLFAVKEKYGSLEEFILTDLTKHPKEFEEYKKIMQEVKKENKMDDISIFFGKGDFKIKEVKTNISKTYAELTKGYDSFEKLKEEKLEYLFPISHIDKIYLFKDRPDIRIHEIDAAEDGSAMEYEVVFDPKTRSLLDKGVAKEDIVEFYNYYFDSAFQDIIINEVNARTINSLMNVYFGEATIHNWEIDNADLEYLSKYTFNGEKIFWKGIEKYRVGKIMKAEGVENNKIRDALEYATEFSYKGRNYIWPESNVDIKLENASSS